MIEALYESFIYTNTDRISPGVRRKHYNNYGIYIIYLYAFRTDIMGVIIILTQPYLENLRYFDYDRLYHYQERLESKISSWSDEWWSPITTDEYTRAQEEYLNLIRNYGAATIGAHAVMSRIAKAENLSIMKSGEFWKLDNEIATQPQEAPCQEGAQDMARKKIPLTISGERIWVTGNTMQEVLENALSRIQPLKAPAPVTTPLFKDYASQWFEMYERPKIKPNHANNSISLLRKHIYPVFGEKQLHDITTEDIQSFFNEKIEAEYAHSTMQKMKILLNQIFESAVEDKLIERNPTASNRLFISDIKTDRHPLSPSQLKQVFSRLDCLTVDQKKIFLICLFTGMRRGEALGLTWEDIDFDQHRLCVHQAVTFSNNAPVIGSPKTESGKRCVPLCPTLADFLESLPDTRQGIICLDPITHKPYTEKRIRATWKQIQKGLGLPDAITPHILRHTFATYVAPGLDPKMLQGILGHADSKVTMDTYTHLQEGKVGAYANVIEQQFVQVCSEIDTKVDTAPNPQTVDS